MKAEIIRSNRKSIELEICPDGHLKIRAPYGMPEDEIWDFVMKKSGWIAKNRGKMKAEQEKRAKEPPVLRLSMEELRELANQAIAILPGKVRYYAEQIGVDYGRITIRNQKTRWGSCSGKGNLNFNCLLMLAPEEVQNYVVVHELCHRKQMNHSKKFWEEVAKIMPDYEEQRRWLRENGEELMRRMLGN